MKDDADVEVIPRRKFDHVLGSQVSTLFARFTARLPPLSPLHVRDHGPTY